MKNCIFSTIIFLIASSASANICHRAGSHVYTELPENSISSLKAVVFGHQSRPAIELNKSCKYIEADVQETADGQLVIFHDSTLKRMLPNNEINQIAIKNILSDTNVRRRMRRTKKTYNSLRIKHVTLAQLQTLVLKKSTNERVPSLEQFLEVFAELGVKKPLALDIKTFYTNSARRKMISLARSFRENVLSRINTIFVNSYDMSKTGISFIGNRKSVWNSLNVKFFSSGKWCKALHKNGFSRVYKVLKHRINLCKRGGVFASLF